jgi:hypothetical protein
MNWQVRFTFSHEPDRPSALYGFVTEDEARASAAVLETIPQITSIYLMQLAKRSKRGPWDKITKKVK